MEKALEVLTDMHSIYKGDHRITQALNEVKEAMKTKTCSSCKYWDFNEQGHFKRCFNGKGNVVSTEADFGCNRYEQKEQG